MTRPRRRPGHVRTAIAAGVAVAVTLAAAGCQREPAPPREVVETHFLDRLSGSIDAVNRTRARVVRDANAVTAAAAALDSADDAAARGDRATARGRRSVVPAAVAKAGKSVGKLTFDIRDYRAAVDVLASAPREGLDDAQSRAVDAVVEAARAEVTGLTGYVTAVRNVWPRYVRLDELQQLWVTRASAGWYRDQQEAAGAYAVLTDPERDALTRGRRALATADRRRLAAARAVDAELARARRALAPLLG